MRRLRYKLEDKLWALENAKNKNLTAREAAGEVTEHLKRKDPYFRGEVSVNVFRGWKRLRLSEEDLSDEGMSSKKKPVYKYSTLETGIFHFLKLLTNPLRTRNRKKVKYTSAVVKLAAKRVRNSTLLVLQKSLWWKDLVGVLPPDGVREGIDKVERFRASRPWCTRFVEVLMKEERQKGVLSFVPFKNLEIGADVFTESLESAVVKVLEGLDLDTGALLSLQCAKKMKGLGDPPVLQWKDTVIDLRGLRAIEATGSMCSSTMLLYCSEMARRGNEEEEEDILWVMPPRILCKLLDVGPSLSRRSICDILRSEKEDGLQIDKAKKAEKVLFPLPRTDGGGLHRDSSDWSLVLVDKIRKQTCYFEARRAADLKCCKFKSAAEMCVLLTHKLSRPRGKRICKKDLMGYTYFQHQIGEQLLPRIESFRCSGLFVCKVAEWICTKKMPIMKTYQKDVRNYGEVIRRVVVEVCLGTMHWQT